jgi:hypothetical protein
VAGIAQLQPAAVHNTEALTVLLGSEQPHLAEAINNCAVMPATRACPLPVRVTPLHSAFFNGR